MSDLILKFLVRPGCHLCDDARPLVKAEAARARATLEEVNIDEDDELLALYGLRIPVVLGSEGQVVAEGIIDNRRVLRGILKELRSG